MLVCAESGREEEEEEEEEAEAAVAQWVLGRSPKKYICVKNCLEPTFSYFGWIFQRAHEVFFELFSKPFFS